MKDAFKTSWMVAAALALSLAACDGVGVNELGLEGEPCPCAEQWTCCENRNVCVRNGAMCPAGPDASTPGAADASPGSGDPDAGRLGPIVVADGLTEPYAMATDGDWVYVADRGGEAVLRLDFDHDTLHPSFDGATVVAAGQAFPVALAVGDSGDVYWANEVGGEIMALRRGSPENEPVAIASGQEQPVGVAVAGEHVYWATRGDGTSIGSIARVPRTGGEVEVLASGLPEPADLAVGPTYVYWTNAGTTSGGGSVARVLRGGGEVDTLATGQDRPTQIEFAHSELYWLARGEGGSRRVMTMALPGEDPSAAVDDGEPMALALDPDGRVFFTGDAEIGRIAYDGSRERVLELGSGADDGTILHVRERVLEDR